MTFQTADQTCSLYVIVHSPDPPEAPVTVRSSRSTLLPLDFILPSSSLLSEEGVGFIFFYCILFFKEYGCSRTERIQKWLGALSNALLKIHYKDG